jgi:hypothetical protein
MSEVKVNKISPRSGTEVTLGDSGDTFTIPSGATINNQGTATNFGATGSASWVTTVKTSTFTAVAGEGYFVNTTGGAVTVNLPAGSAGAVVAVKDYAGTFDTNKVTLVQNGSDKIGGSTDNSLLETEGLAVTLVFIDSTQGWLVTDSGLQGEAPGPEFISATGGTITTVCTNFKVHTFTGPGTFTVCSVGNPAGSNTVSYMVVAGGGGAGQGYPSSNGGGGGGAGGFRESKASSDSYTASPLNATSGPFYNLPVSVTSFPITVGAGGVGSGGGQRASGTASTFSTITSAGGGGGGNSGPSQPQVDALTGGSGGGGAGGTSSASWGSGAAGNTPPTTPPQGNPGGDNQKIASGSGTDNSGGAGGGATAAGGDGGLPLTGGAGGAGATTSITASPTAYAGGGGGGGSPNGAGGTGGGGSGGSNGSTNTGGGGGGNYGPAGTGGSGIVVIRYKFQ